MNIDLQPLLHLSGLLAILGALLYAVGDVLMLAPRVGPLQSPPAREDATNLYPYPRRHAILLAELAALPPGRLIAGGLLGVFATPLVLAGVALVSYALQPANAWLALPPIILLTVATVLGPFIHGSFIYLGAHAQAVQAVDARARAVLVPILSRYLRMVKASYGVLFLCAIPASLWFAAAVASGQTRLPQWMALANPLLLTLAWLALRRVLPRRVLDYTQGAGFNIANGVFMGALTVMLW